MSRGFWVVSGESLLVKEKMRTIRMHLQYIAKVFKCNAYSSSVRVLRNCIEYDL